MPLHYLNPLVCAMFFALAKLPQAIVIWFLVLAATEGGLAIIHVFAGGMSRSRMANRVGS